MSPTYKAWSNMVQRCCNRRCPSWARYGKRGISVCDRWLVFSAFLADMGEKPVGLTLERVNNALGYVPGNCVWATVSAQSRNRRTTRLVTIEGRTQCLKDWAKEKELSYIMVLKRVLRGWAPEVALQ